MSIKEIDQGCFEVGEEEGSFPWKVLSMVIGDWWSGDWWLVIGDKKEILITKFHQSFKISKLHLAIGARVRF